MACVAFLGPLRCPLAGLGGEARDQTYRVLVARRARPRPTGDYAGGRACQNLSVLGARLGGSGEEEDKIQEEPGQLGVATTHHPSTKPGAKAYS